MSIGQTDVIDAMAANGSELVMLVSDHFTWLVEQVQHLKYLQKKLNTYIRFIDNKGWKEKFGDIEFETYKIEVVFKYQWHEAFERMIESVRDKLDERHIKITYRVGGNEDEKNTFYSWAQP